MEELVVECFNCFADLPGCAVAGGDVVGDGAQLQEGYALLEAYIVEGGAFHAFHSGIEARGAGGNGGRMAADGMNGDATDGRDVFDGNRNVLEGVHQAAVAEREGIFFYKAHCEDVYELLVVFGTEIAEHFAMNGDEAAQWEGGIEGAANACLEHKIVGCGQQGFGEGKGGGHQAYAGDAKVYFPLLVLADGRVCCGI